MSNRKVYYLSPDRIDTIDNQEDSEYKVFEEFLDAALKKRNIRNIAVTGNFGIGKSRFLHYYGEKRKFLLVSGCSFMEPGKPDGEDKTKQVEYNLIYQLLLGCRRYVGSGISHGMPLKQINWVASLQIITGLLLICTAFLLTLAPKLEPYLRELGLYNSTAISIVYIGVCVGLIFSLCVDVSVFFWRYRHILRFKSVSVELGGAKLSVEPQDGISFLIKTGMIYYVFWLLPPMRLATRWYLRIWIDWKGWIA